MCKIDKPFVPKIIHKTEKISLKEVEVDKEIIPVVKWLNSFPEVYTFFSCEGSCSLKPYVLFMTTCQSSLTTIVNDIQLYNHGKISVSVYAGILRYTIYFHSKKSLSLFIKKIDKRYKF